MIFVADFHDLCVMEFGLYSANSLELIEVIFLYDFADCFG